MGPASLEALLTSVLVPVVPVKAIPGLILPVALWAVHVFSGLVPGIISHFFKRGIYLT